MKKVWLIFVLMLVLSGFRAEETFETVQDSYEQMAISQKALTFTVPADAATQVFHSENGSLYFCDGYEIVVQTLAGGDLDRTLRSLTGFGRDNLTVVEMMTGNCMRYECAWVAAGEGGDQVGRTAILDDGQYHYCLSVLTSADDAGSLQESWKEIFLSLDLQS